MNDLHGKVAIVTGASKGIGAGIAKAMATAGACVTVNYATDKEGANRVVEEIARKRGRAIAVQGDVSRAPDAARIVSTTVETFGGLHVLVNNAAYFKFDPLEEITENEFHRHFNINVLGALLMTKEAVRRFGPGACVINIASAGILSPTPNGTLYSATKAALDMVTQVLAKELGPRKIRVNSIWPGATDTEGNRRIGLMEGDTPRLIAERTALERIGLPSDIAPAAVFLASDDAAWITGAALNVSGGFR
jgi:3-oxoacyl-[acyl-carrier protein] reductase